MIYFLLHAPKYSHKTKNYLKQKEPDKSRLTKFGSIIPVGE